MFFNFNEEFYFKECLIIFTSRIGVYGLETGKPWNCLRVSWPTQQMTRWSPSTYYGFCSKPSSALISVQSYALWAGPVPAWSPSAWTWWTGIWMLGLAVKVGFPELGTPRRRNPPSSLEYRNSTPTRFGNLRCITTVSCKHRTDR